MILTDDTLCSSASKFRYFLASVTSQFLDWNPDQATQGSQISDSVTKVFIDRNSCSFLRLAGLLVSTCHLSRPCQLDSSRIRPFSHAWICFCTVAAASSKEVDSRVWQVTTGQVTMCHLNSCSTASSVISHGGVSS